jgi:hypothetical protein
MTDIFDNITIGDMKIGVALPVPNNSFKFWDDPGTWAAPEKWTKNNVGALRHFEAYDGDRAAVQIAGASVPDDETYNLQSTIKRWWNDNDGTAYTTISKVYWGAALYVHTLSGGGGNEGAYLQIGYDDNEAFSSPTWETLVSTSGVVADWVYYTGTKTTASMDVDEPWVGARLVLRDATVISARLDCVGMMVDPIGNDGAYTLTNVRSVTPPDQVYGRYAQDGETRLGTTNRVDTSGGATKLRLRVQFQNETIATYEALKRFHDYNLGTPGMAPLPLMLEPNLPGYPPMFMCNIEEKRFPLTRDSNWGDTYGGSMTFVGVWP